MKALEDADEAICITFFSGKPCLFVLSPHAPADTSFVKIVMEDGSNARILIEKAKGILESIKRGRIKGEASQN